MSEAKDNKRIEWIDFAKGIAILLVVFGHSTELLYSESEVNNLIHTAIYSFHMPLFFLLSGMIFSDTKYKKFLKFFWNKFITVLLPSYTFLILGYIIKFIRSIDLSYTPKRAIRTLLQFRAHNMGNFWFLPTLFVALIIMWGIHHFIRNKKCRLLISGLISAVGALYIVYIGKPLPFSIDNSCLVIFFMEIGNQIKDNKSFLKHKKKILAESTGIWGLSTFVNWYFFGKHPVSLSYNIILNPILFFISAIAGSLIVVVICIKINRVKYVNFWGRNTLIIYLISSYILNIFVRLISQIKINNQFLCVIICMIISIITTHITAIISVGIYKYLPFVVGRRRKNNAAQ